MQEGDGCEYYFVLQQGAGLSQPDPLPVLPSNARYINHPNECFDIGTVGWLLRSKFIPDLKIFKYFIWLNSSVRGPFMPTYLRGQMHWTEPFLAKLIAGVKLVGATINCGRAYDQSPTIHIQSYISATDAVGLGLLAASTVFECGDEIKDTIVDSEIGASKAILEAGYNIDSLMLRYQVMAGAMEHRGGSGQKSACDLCCLVGNHPYQWERDLTFGQ